MKKRVTIKDVAAQAGVAYQTVSKVINGHAHVLPKTETRIWDAARALGYRANHSARSLRAQRSQMIGYSWVPTQPDQANHILDMFLSSMVEEAEAAGYHLLPFPYREGEDLVGAYRELIESGRVDGFVLSSMNYNDPRVPFLQERQAPFVAFGRTDAQATFPFVDIDGAAGMRAATEHLLERGHRRVAVLAWPEGSRVGDDRLAGYLAAMRAAQVDVKPEWLAHSAGDFEFGIAATQRWLDGAPAERPTAVVAMNDTLAVGAMSALLRQGLAPGRDLAIVGFDDTPMAQYLWPPLSSVRQPIREAGHKCVEMLIRLLEKQPIPESQILLPPTLWVRQSSSAPAG